MPNYLTGDYDAVFQISVRKINAILATMHQSAINPAASPTFPHCAVIPIGQLPSVLQTANSAFVTWVGSLAQQAVASGSNVEKELPIYYTRSLPAISEMYNAAWAGLRTEHTPEPSSGRIHGTVLAQISTPTIMLRGGATAEIIVKVDVRAHFFPDSGAATLPEPLHGRLEAVYTTATKTISGRKVVHVQAPARDDQVQFYAASGTNLNAADVNTIAGEVRKVLRKHFIPEDVDLPVDFPASEFIALGGSGETIALPLQLSGGGASGGIGSITNDLLGASDFAIAISKQYVDGVFGKMIQAMRDYAAGITISVSGTFGSTVYHASVAYMTMTWKTGAIEIAGKIDLTTRSVLPNGYISFTQALVLDLDVPSQAVTLKPAGDPSVDESWWLSHSLAVNKVKSARDSALDKNSLGNTFNDVRNKLIAAVRKFDKYGDVRYLLAEITLDGMLLHGKIDLSGRLDPVVEFSDTGGGNDLTAFQSWIPGGTIDSFTWTWPEGAVWASHVGSKNDAHRFIVHKTAGTQSAYHVCLSISGTRVTPSGLLENVTAGHTCKPTWSEPILVVPGWWARIMMPLWAPNPAPDRPLEDAVKAHINVAGQPNEPGRMAANALVHFTGDRMNQPLQTLGQVMSLSRRQDSSLVLILVLPRGAFRQSRRELETKLGKIGERFTGKLIITEDYEGGWTKTFSAKETPSTFLLNAHREFVWKHAGEIDARAFAAALDEHLVPAPAAPNAPMQTRVQVGTLVPDAVFADENGERIALRRLRGRSFILCFWQSWSQASLRELRGLQSTLDGGDDRAQLVFGINGGEEKDVLPRTRSEQHLTFPMLEDPEQRVANQFGIQCWPTTIRVNPDGIVDRIQFGLSYEHREEKTQSTA